MSEDAMCGAARVRLLAACAGLTLPPEREARVAAVLDAWLPDANALNSKMGAPGHRELVPATILVHASAAEHEE
ncbi:MAG TPA: hypothetical protein PK177_00530 [Burkholderiaceae bacterium]|nr:hypothetical protein [Burkholderiaceae bacterium]